MNVLVTGGAGFRGSHFVRALLGDRLPGLEGASVTVLDNLTYAGSFANLGAVAHDKRLDFVPGDVADAPLIEAVLRRHDTIVHFAGADQPVAGLAAANVTGTQVLLEAARRWDVTRFLHVSPGAVHGPVTGRPWREDAPPAPVTPYAAARAGADLLVQAYRRNYGVPAVIVRVADTYGPRQHPRRPVPQLVTALLSGRPAPPPGGAVRDWLHVDDLSRAVGLVLAAGTAEIYNVGGSVELSGRDLHEMIRRECRPGPDPAEHTADTPTAGVAEAGHRTADAPPASNQAADAIPAANQAVDAPLTADQPAGAPSAHAGEPGAPAPHDEVAGARSVHDHPAGEQRYALDDERLREELGWAPQVEFAAGLAATVRWYRDNEDWWRLLLDD